MGIERVWGKHDPVTLQIARLISRSDAYEHLFHCAKTHRATSVTFLFQLNGPWKIVYSVWHLPFCNRLRQTANSKLDDFTGYSHRKCYVQREPLLHWIKWRCLLRHGRVSLPPVFLNSRKFHDILEYPGNEV